MCKYIYEFKPNLVMTGAAFNLAALHALSGIECNYLYDKQTQDLIAKDLEVIPIITPVGYSQERIDLAKAWQIRMNRISSYLNEVPAFKSGKPIAFMVGLYCPKDYSLIETNKWIEDTIAWLKDTFNKAPDGQSNILSLTLERYHQEDHLLLNATIVPINENGEFVQTPEEDPFWNNEMILSSYLKANHIEYLNDKIIDKPGRPSELSWILKITNDSLSESSANSMKDFLAKIYEEKRTA